MSNSSPGQNPWDSPYFSRPSLNDFNSAQKSNDPSAPPPNPTTDPSAEEYNELCFLAVALAQMVPSAEVYVLASSSPSISSVVSPNDAVNGNAAAFTLTRTAAGNYTITTTAGATALPAPPNGAPAKANIVGTLDGTHNYSIAATYVSASSGLYAIQVTTALNGTLTDMNFVVTFR
jgi:hypothetical protein